MTHDVPDLTSRPDADTRIAVLPHLATAATACAEARRFVAEHLRRWNVPYQVSDTVALLTSELIANAVRHGQPPLCLQLDVDDHRVRVEVSDSNPVLPVLPRSDFEAVGGRGLWLVDTLARASGCTPWPPGKVVWCEVALIAAQRWARLGPDRDRGPSPERSVAPTRVLSVARFRTGRRRRR
ncbi:ATP-binding protein [Micromonospora sp. BQ11]|uniref:ATP-binding protein n=1 Tax=Micromonospora sp. BQ11 TaxID=3452212 RepID=UPI003F8BCCEA